MVRYFNVKKFNKNNKLDKIIKHFNIKKNMKNDC